MSYRPALLLAAVSAACWMSPTLRAQPAAAAGVILRTNVAYKAEESLSAYEQERCRLDLYLPAGREGFATLVWFHGGGLKVGDRQDARPIALSFAESGLAVVCPNYRLSPAVHFPAYVEDAAAAVAWSRKHVAAHGGDPDRVFVGGHSAGAWLTLMIGLDERYLQNQGLEPSALAGLIPVSGQTMTHFTVREERGLGRFTIIVDEAAPVHYVRQDTPPMLLIYADNDMVARAEENAYFVALMKGAGNAGVDGLLVRDRDHGSIASNIVDPDDPARAAILEFIKTHSEPPR